MCYVLLSPVEIVRVLAVVRLEADLDLLGPFGAYVYDSLGRGGTTALLSVALGVWFFITGAAGVLAFHRKA